MYDDGNLLPWNTKKIENFNLIEKLLIFIRCKLPFFHLNTIGALYNHNVNDIYLVHDTVPCDFLTWPLLNVII